MSDQEPKPSVNEMSPLEAALYYARRGWKVFPSSKGGSVH
jgi:hypothetical protein